MFKPTRKPPTTLALTPILIGGLSGWEKPPKRKMSDPGLSLPDLFTSEKQGNKSQGVQRGEHG